jgi:hypothetical protein
MAIHRRVAEDAEDFKNEWSYLWHFQNHFTVRAS